MESYLCHPIWKRNQEHQTCGRISTNMLNRLYVNIPERDSDSEGLGCAIMAVSFLRNKCCLYRKKKTQ